MAPVPWLHHASDTFPAPHKALDEPNGLLAAGGDLSAARLVSAYRQGIFPWFEDDELILWWSPNPRCVIFPDELHISRSLHRRLHRQDFHVTADQAFAEVVSACAAPRRGERDHEELAGTWITDAMAAAYQNLYELGHAHSIEVWRDDTLIGGMYGVAQGEVFFGESMFSRQTDGSKIAMVYLAAQLQEWGYALLDCQIPNDHLLRMGARSINRSSFLELLQSRVQRSGQASPWAITWSYSK